MSEIKEAYLNFLFSGYEDAPAHVQKLASFLANKDVQTKFLHVQPMIEREGYESDVQRNAVNFLFCQMRFGGHSFVQSRLDALIRYHSLENESWWQDWSGLVADLDEHEQLF